MLLRNPIPLLVMCLATSVAFADQPPSAVKVSTEEQLAFDQFDRQEIAPWLTVVPTFEIENGVLIGRQTRDDHGAVGRLPLQFADVRVDLRFRLEGSKTFNVVFDDKKYKGSHAGHIARVAVAPNQIRLGDDKEGIMRNDIFELRRDPARKAEAEPLLVGRGLTVQSKIEQQRWYDMTIVIQGDVMQVTLDGQKLGQLQSSGLAHRTKTSVHFSVNGPRAAFDNVRVTRLN
ncbi:MAG: hypothetical protein ACK5Q5_13695 [Planctomycetaceae bacterium]